MWSSLLVALPVPLVYKLVPPERFDLPQLVDLPSVFEKFAEIRNRNFYGIVTFLRNRNFYGNIFTGNSSYLQKVI